MLMKLNNIGALLVCLVVTGCAKQGGVYPSKTITSQPALVTVVGVADLRSDYEGLLYRRGDKLGTFCVVTFREGGSTWRVYGFKDLRPGTTDDLFVLTYPAVFCGEKIVNRFEVPDHNQPRALWLVWEEPPEVLVDIKRVKMLWCQGVQGKDSPCVRSIDRAMQTVFAVSVPAQQTVLWFSWNISPLSNPKSRYHLTGSGNATGESWPIWFTDTGEVMASEVPS
jgi:hypothetical protein